jgi:hypothetical protein
VGVAGIGANPAALGYCAILIAFWAGIATPTPSSSERSVMPRRLGGAATVALVLIAAIPVGTTTGATLAFDQAREQSRAGEFDRAIESMNVAVLLDPTFPLYARQRGILLLRQGRDAHGIDDLVAASVLNPLDDNTFRALALARLAQGDIDAALRAGRTAAVLQATDPMNQVTLALSADAAGLQQLRDDALASLLVLAPWSAADESWAARFADVEPAEILRSASDLVTDRPVADTVDMRWTVTLAGGSGVTRDAGYSASQEAFALLISCKPAEATRVMNESGLDDWSDPDHAFTHAVLARMHGAPLELNPAVIPPDPLAVPSFGDPVGDQARYARLSPPPWEGIQLPSNTGGRLAWLEEPDRAISVTRGSPCP